MSHTFSGLVTALVTPFLRGEVDYRSFQRLVEYQLDAGVQGFVVNGTTGESPTLKFDEVRKLFELTRQICASQVPVILGTGSNCTRKTVEMTQFAGQWGADGALVVTPYYNKPPQRGLVAHFQQVAEASQIPVLLYNVPGRTVVGLTAETILELAGHSQIVGLKEASGDLNFARQLAEQLPKDFTLTSGDDDSCLGFVLAGGKGVISVVSHIIPSELRKLLDRAGQGDSVTLQDYQKFQPLLKAVYCESNPIPVKAALYLMGVIDSPELRLPLVTLHSQGMENLRQVLVQLDKLGS